MQLTESAPTGAKNNTKRAAKAEPANDVDARANAAQAQIDAATQALAKAEQAAREALAEFQTSPSTATFTASEVAKQVALNAVAALEATRAAAELIFAEQRRSASMGEIAELTEALAIDQVTPVVSAFAAAVATFKAAVSDYSDSINSAVRDQKARVQRLELLSTRLGVPMPPAVGLDLPSVLAAANRVTGVEVWEGATSVTVGVK